MSTLTSVAFVLFGLLGFVAFFIAGYVYGCSNQAEERRARARSWSCCLSALAHLQAPHRSDNEGKKLA